MITTWPPCLHHGCGHDVRWSEAYFFAPSSTYISWMVLNWVRWLTFICLTCSRPIYCQSTIRVLFAKHYLFGYSLRYDVYLPWRFHLECDLLVWKEILSTWFVHSSFPYIRQWWCKIDFSQFKLSKSIGLMSLICSCFWSIQFYMTFVRLNMMISLNRMSASVVHNSINVASNLVFSYASTYLFAVRSSKYIIGRLYSLHLLSSAHFYCSSPCWLTCGWGILNWLS